MSHCTRVATKETGVPSSLNTLVAMFSSSTQAFYMRRACIKGVANVVPRNLPLVPSPSALNPALREAEGDQLSQRCHHHCAGGICLAPQAVMGHLSQPRLQGEATTPVLEDVLGHTGAPAGGHRQEDGLIMLQNGYGQAA